MCEYFVKADPIQYEQRTRTVRIRNVLTSLRLENMVWDILAEMAEEEGCTTNALISNFHDEILAHRGEVPNFASFLRVTSMRYLRRCVISMERSQSQALPVANVMSIPNRPQTTDTPPKQVAAVGR
ncbi:MAG: ribbon-helix-helix domain-containing protein [Rhodoferax sp.]|nr:ribbon-helix-helix domain-containing protein [Rhodoferax sp.]